MSEAGHDALTGELLSLARAAAVEASAMIADRAGASDLRVSSKSSPTDMVTEVDRASERLIVELILAERPDDEIIGEEGADHSGTSGVSWLIDPLDGTTNFMYGYPGFNVSIGVSVDGDALVGVVADPAHDAVYTARAGHGARCNDRPIAASAQQDLASALVATGFSYDPGRRARQAELLRDVLPRIRDIRRGGAAALDLCWVAAGRVDGYYEHGLSPWDFAAGALIAAEAGARVSAIDGGPPRPGSVFAAAPGIADDLRSLLVEAGA